MATKKKTSSLKQKVKKTAKSEVKKQVKKRPIFAIVLFLLLAVGGVGGFFGAKFLTANDTFALVGEANITLTVGEEYVEEGVTIISFGKDISDKVEIESNVDTSVAGEYYIKYTVEGLRFGSVARYRYVKVVEVGNEE